MQYQKLPGFTQKSLLKIGMKRWKRFHSDALFREANVLTTYQLFIKNLLDHIFKNSWSTFTISTH